MELAKKHITWQILLVIFIDNIVFSLIESTLMVQKSQGSYEGIPYFFVLRLVCPLFNNFLLRPMIDRLAYQIKHDFDIESIKKYDTMSFESNNNKSSTMFWEKMVPHRGQYI